jgi:hypothetical protein
MYLEGLRLMSLFLKSEITLLRYSILWLQYKFKVHEVAFNGGKLSTEITSNN